MNIIELVTHSNVRFVRLSLCVPGGFTVQHVMATAHEEGLPAARLVCVNLIIVTVCSLCGGYIVCEFILLQSRILCLLRCII